MAFAATAFFLLQNKSKGEQNYVRIPNATPNKVNSPQPGNGDEGTIDLLELFYALLSKWKQLAAATVACALIAAIGVLFL